jgi:UTP--glucose-1-phosphate uridylyltransferase
MIQIYHNTEVSQIMFEAVPGELVSDYGVIGLQCAEVKAGDSIPMGVIVGEPKQEGALSNLAVVGRYVINKKIGNY